VPVCNSDYSRGEIWPLHVVSAPASLAFAAWCVHVRGRFEGGSPLHAWTARFGVCAALHGASLLVFPGLTCGLATLTYADWQLKVSLGLATLTYYATVFVQWHLLLLRLIHNPTHLSLDRQKNVEHHETTEQ
ncbi:unnamed protein product, partial [Prorocentrum cordatum]